jgi:hypothetical protein
MDEHEPTTTRPPRGRYQYSLASLLLLTALVSVLAAALGGMLRREYFDSPTPAVYFLMMAIAAPIGVMIVVSLLRAAVRWAARSRRR